MLEAQVLQQRIASGFFHGKAVVREQLAEQSHTSIYRWQPNERMSFGHPRAQQFRTSRISVAKDEDHTSILQVCGLQFCKRLGDDRGLQSWSGTERPCKIEQR